MLVSVGLLLVSMATLGASHPAQMGETMVRERRTAGGAVMAGSFYSAPLRKQECENCNQLAGELAVDEAPAEADQEHLPEEAPALIDETPVEESPVPKPQTSKASKGVPREKAEEGGEPSPRKGGRRTGSVFKNFFSMSFGGGRAVRAAAEGDADVQADARAEPEEHGEDGDEDEDEDGELSAGSRYENFFPMTFAVRPRFVREAEPSEGGRGVGGVISIANSFSKGRGAVATSSATAYGAPADNNQQRSAPPALEE